MDILRFSDLKSISALCRSSPRFRTLIQGSAAVVCNAIVDRLIYDLKMKSTFDLQVVSVFLCSFEVREGDLADQMPRFQVQKWLVPKPNILTIFNEVVDKQGVWGQIHTGDLVPKVIDGLGILTSPGPQFLYLLESQQSSLSFYQTRISKERKTIKDLESAIKSLGERAIGLKEGSDELLKVQKMLSGVQHKLEEGRRNLLRDDNWFMICTIKPTLQKLIRKILAELVWFWGAGKIETVESD